ncbi:MAG TPA: sialidase family protein, partial [Thermoanaerobaculia bacterium]|nr:sialidase family protein [Thermoanaerobaculia bacterium]
MRPVSALLVLALVSACGSSDPSTSGPPRRFQPRPPRALAEGVNVVPLDPVGASIEASVASVPGDPRRLAANVMKLRPGQRSRLQAYYSHDGGATWAASAQIPFIGSNGREYNGQGDAVMAADRAGRLYSALLLTKGLGTYEFSAVGVSRSDDGGATWSTPAVITEDAWGGGASPFNDKEWIAVDNSGGSRDGTVYVVWQRMDQMVVGVNSKFLISRSTDQGRTWTAPRETSAPEPGGWSMIDIGPEGEVYIARWSQGRCAFVWQVSSDGGETFTAPVMITRGSGVPVQQPPTHYSPYPRLHADRSFGAHRGNVYFVSPATATAPDGRRVSAPGI